MDILNLIGVPFQYVLGFLNSITGSYAVAILIFTVVINIVLSPLNIKQQKSMAQQARLKPKLDALKEKYGDDRVKMSNAQQELYQSENISPTGGCLPLVARMVILMGIYGAVRQLVEKTTDKSCFNLFGLDLSQTPSFTNGFNALWLIPILSGVAALISMLISQYQQKKINPAMQQAGGMMKGMMLIMPIFSVYIAFSIQAAVGYYWIISNIVNTVITVVVNQLYSANKILATDAADTVVKRRKYEAERISRV